MEKIDVQSEAASTRELSTRALPTRAVPTRTLQIRALQADDFQRWKGLFAGYCDFYQLPADEQKISTMWGWLNDPLNMLEGVVACDETGQIVGLAHFHGWPQSLLGTEVCYLSDLYVDPESRVGGVGKALYRYMLALCKQRGWSALTLLTHKDNRVARGLYDQFGEASDFRFYETPVD